MQEQITSKKLNQAVIMAAGESSRFWPFNQVHKSLLRVMGKPIIAYTIEALIRGGITDIVVVQGWKKDVQTALQGFSFSGGKISYVVEEEPLGTGDAILSAKEFLQGKFLVLNAERFDVEDCLKTFFENKSSNVLLSAAKTEKPWLYGILKVEGDRVVDIIEKPGQGKEPSDLKLMGIYQLSQDFLPYLENEPKHPFSLIFAYSKYAKEHEIKYFIAREGEGFSLKFPWDLFALRDQIFAKFLQKKTARSAKLAKNVVISGDVCIGENVVIGEGTVIFGPCYIADNCQIGPSNVLRGPLDLEDGVKTGSFMEIKDSLIGKGTHFHSGYLGNSVVGTDCRFGAGFVSGNRRLDRGNIKATVKGQLLDTKTTYLGAIVGNDCHFGINASTMPGIIVGNNCTIGANTAVNKNLEDRTIFYSQFQNTEEKKS